MNIVCDNFAVISGDNDFQTKCIVDVEKQTGKVWKPRYPSPPPLGGKNHATSYHIINCLLGRPNESGVSVP